MKEKGELEETKIVANSELQNQNQDLASILTVNVTCQCYIERPFLAGFSSISLSSILSISSLLLRKLTLGIPRSILTQVQHWQVAA